MNTARLTVLSLLTICLLAVSCQVVYYSKHLLEFAGFGVRRHPSFFVHLDFKGAPPRVAYVHRLLAWLGLRRVSGVLLEYETMFPFDQKLKEFASRHHYSHEDIADMILTAEQLQMEVIPYVPTFARLEHFAHHPDVVDGFGGSSRSVNSWNACHKLLIPEGLIREMLDQILSLHPNSRYIHIGKSQLSSEEMSNQPRCLQMLNTSHGMATLFLHHLEFVSLHIRRYWPDIKILAMADVLENLPDEELERFTDLMQPVVVNWGAEKMNVTVDLLKRGSSKFGHVWGASAFKGRHLPNANFVPLRETIQNHQLWKNLVRAVKKEHFSGLMLMGPSRHAHTAPLCELLPVALPSLALAMAVVLTNFTEESGHRTAVELGFNGFVYKRPFIEEGRLNFPGSAVFRAVSELEVTMNDNKEREKISLDDDYLDRLETSLKELYPRYVVNEWLKLKVKAWTSDHVHNQLRPFIESENSSVAVISNTPSSARRVKLSERANLWLGKSECIH